MGSKLVREVFCKVDTPLPKTSNELEDIKYNVPAAPFEHAIKVKTVLLRDVA